MDFYTEAIRTLKILAHTVHGDGNKSVWRDRQHQSPPCYHGRNAFDSKRFLSTRLKIRPCNKLIKPVITA